MKNLLAAISLCIFSLPVIATPSLSPTDLAKKSQNPVEDMISIPFDFNFNEGYGPNNGTQVILDIKPVIPIHLNSSFNLISRTILPIVHQPNLFPDRDYINGIGDLNPSLYLTPANPGLLIWGIGPTIILPTASNKQSGQGKYSAGPSFVLLSMPGHWVLGFLTFNVWSFAGNSSYRSVNEFELQYFINYNFSHGWYLTTQPIITANWLANTANDCWTIPFGFGGGHVFSIDHQPLNISLQAYRNIKSPKITGANWQLQFNVSFLFPS